MTVKISLIANSSILALAIYSPIANGQPNVQTEKTVDDFEIVGERFRYLTLPNPWVDKLCTGTLWAQWP